MPATPSLSSEDEAVMSRRKFLQTAGAAALALGANETIAGSTESIHKAQNKEAGFERLDDLSGYVKLPDGNTLNIEVSINCNKVGKDGKPEVKVLINGKEKAVISYHEYGKNQKGVALGDARDISSVETIAFDGKKKTYQVHGKDITLPIQSTKSI